jgi:virulence-associated protein VagC
METLVIERRTLPLSVASHFDVARVKVEKEEKRVILSPADEEKEQDIYSLIDELCGIFTDGKLSTEDFIKQKAIEVEMEN